MVLLFFSALATGTSFGVAGARFELLGFHPPAVLLGQTDPVNNRVFSLAR